MSKSTVKSAYCRRCGNSVDYIDSEQDKTGKCGECNAPVFLNERFGELDRMKSELQMQRNTVQWLGFISFFVWTSFVVLCRFFDAEIILGIAFFYSIWVILYLEHRARQGLNIRIGGMKSEMESIVRKIEDKERDEWWEREEQRRHEENSARLEKQRTEEREAREEYQRILECIKKSQNETKEEVEVF